MDKECIVYDFAQRTEEWHAIRKGKLTASSFDKLLTPATGKLSKQAEGMIIDLCVACLVEEEEPSYSTYAMDRGIALESEARREFIDRTGYEVLECGFITRTDLPVVGCSPDGLVRSHQAVAPGIAGAHAGLEIKCPMAKNHARYLLDGVLPAQYKPQVHGAMAITGLSEWWFLSYHPEMDNLLIQVCRDEYTEKMKEALIEFSARYEQEYARIMPVLVGKKFRGQVELPGLQ